MDSVLQNQINVSNLIFGMTILPEITIESEYANLVFTPVTAPSLNSESIACNCIICRRKIASNSIQPTFYSFISSDGWL